MCLRKICGVFTTIYNIPQYFNFHKPQNIKIFSVYLTIIGLISLIIGFSSLATGTFHDKERIPGLILIILSGALELFYAIMVYKLPNFCGNCILKPFKEFPLVILILSTFFYSFFTLFFLIALSILFKSNVLLQILIYSTIIIFFIIIAIQAKNYRKMVKNGTFERYNSSDDVYINEEEIQKFTLDPDYNKNYKPDTREKEPEIVKLDE